MNAEIIVVGYEILDGDVLDTNSNWMAKHLSRTGHNLRRITVVEDLIDIIAETLRDVLSRSPGLILVSGGLGPTRDDLTLEGIAKGLGRKLVESPEALRMIESRYRRMFPDARQGEMMTQSRKKMGILPQGAIALNNPIGTAPGVLIREGASTIICLPGVPDELKAIFTDSIVPLLAGGTHWAFRSVLVEGIGESTLAPHLNQVMEELAVEIRSYPSKGIIRLKILGARASDAVERLKQLTGEGVRYKELEAG